jgi:hypothetical protein
LSQALANDWSAFARTVEDEVQPGSSGGFTVVCSPTEEAG